MASALKPSRRRLQALDFLWALMFGLLGVLASSLLPQATVTRDALAGVVFCAIAIAVLTYWPAISARTGSLIVTMPKVAYHPPRWAGRGKLRREAQALVNDIHAYLQAKPPWMTQVYSEHQEGFREMQAAKDETERNEIWERQTAREIERSEREGQELAARFGGRVRYVVGEFVRRGLLPESEAHSLEWEAGNRYHIQRAATTLDALVRKL